VVKKDAHAKLTVTDVIVENEDLDLTKDYRPEIRLMFLRCGDINGDGLINDADLTILWRAGNYNKKTEEADNPWCDLNGDGLINDADLTILWLAYNYNRGAIDIEF
ncbi:MAG: dockerin type I domain-containing protein, partial [Clostridiales bacterium]|nr:dockerin type I domain-containing protein [Clostridiales bacterium]